MKYQPIKLESVLSGKVVNYYTTYAHEAEFKSMLEADPNPEWLEDHPELINADGSPVKYLPIEWVDYLLRAIYVKHYVEVIQAPIYQNSTQIIIRLHVLNPITELWEFQDGVAGASTKQGIETAVAIAEAQARKNAAKKLGKIFGRDLFREQRKIQQEEPKKEAQEEKKTETSNEPLKRALNQIQKSKTIASLKNCMDNAYKRISEGQFTEEDVEEAFKKKMEELEKNQTKNK